MAFHQLNPHKHESGCLRSGSTDAWLHSLDPEYVYEYIHTKNGVPLLPPRDSLALREPEEGR